MGICEAMKYQPQITLAVTAFDESHRGDFEWIRECITPATTHPLVREIAVVNDGTDDIDRLRFEIGALPKVRIYQNETNLGVFGNKVTSVDRSTSEWVLMCDSDNTMGHDYYDRLQSLGEWQSDMMYCSSFARPNFDYRHFCGTWNLDNIIYENERRAFFCLVNTGNWFLHRPTFLEAFRYNTRSRFDLQQPNYFGVPANVREQIYWRHVYDAQDSFFINKTWLLAGHVLNVVHGLEYDHRVDKGTQGNYDRSPVEKEALAPIYLLELNDRAITPREDWSKLSEYRFADQRGSVFFYFISQRDDILATVDINTGEVGRVRK